MADTNATVGYGSTLAFSTDDTTYTPIAQTVDLNGPEPEIGDVKVTNNDSENATHEHLPGLIEPGENEFKVVYAKAACNTLYTMFGTRTVYWWKETYPDGAFWKFKGYMKKFGTEAPTEDGAIMNTIGLKLTKKPTFTPGS